MPLYEIKTLVRIPGLPRVLPARPRAQPLVQPLASSRVNALATLAVGARRALCEDGPSRAPVRWRWRNLKPLRAGRRRGARAGGGAQRAGQRERTRCARARARAVRRRAGCAASAADCAACARGRPQRPPPLSPQRHIYTRRRHAFRRPRAGRRTCRRAANASECRRRSSACAPRSPSGLLLRARGGVGWGEGAERLLSVLAVQWHPRADAWRPWRVRRPRLTEGHGCCCCCCCTYLLTYVRALRAHARASGAR